MWANQTGTCTWGIGVGSAASGLFQSVGGVIDTGLTNKSNQEIANSQNAANECIAKITGGYNTQIAQGNQLTQEQIAKIQSVAGEREAEIQGQAAILAAKNTPSSPISSSTVALLFVGVILTVSVIFIFKEADTK